jgi:hypothetical protein
MRLLDARLLTLQSFMDDFPPYAILSHCWEDEEVVFADLSDMESAKRKRGFDKIEMTCKQAIKDGLDYVWIDTCCIDKSSSAELSEAINSMFAWYRTSEKCYAYLADVDEENDFANSKWFTRAWTLQELLAPSSVQKGSTTGMEFFSRQWEPLGSKLGLSETIAGITGIDKEYLEGKSFSSASISMRMSWAAERRATRGEDVAYSLLGIFDVNMPLLYGEGKVKAFRRLQKEIMKMSEDETLFAWETTQVFTDSSSTDVLASDPKDFFEARNLVPFAPENPVVPYSMTHRGLRIWLELAHFNEPEEGKSESKLRDEIKPLRSPVMIWSSQDLVWATLRCHVAHDFNHRVIIPLRHLTADIYVRDTSTNVALAPSKLWPCFNPSRELYIRNSRTASIASSVQRRFGFLIRNLPKGFDILNVHPKGTWNEKDRILQREADSSGARFWHASLQLGLPQDNSPLQKRYVKFLGLGCEYVPEKETPNPWCHLDDAVRNVDDVGLEAFHGVRNLNETSFSVSHCLSIDGKQSNIVLQVSINREAIFGQRMFVVDIECVPRNRKLTVPEKAMREKMAGPSITVLPRSHNFEANRNFEPNRNAVESRPWVRS